MLCNSEQHPVLGKRQSARSLLEMYIPREKNAPLRTSPIERSCRFTVKATTRKVIANNDEDGGRLADSCGWKVAKAEQQQDLTCRPCMESSAFEAEAHDTSLADGPRNNTNVYNGNKPTGNLKQSNVKEKVNGPGIGKRMRRNCLNCEEQYLLTGEELLEEVCQNTKLCRQAAGSFYQFCMSSKIFVKAVETVVRELIHFSMRRTLGAIVVSKLVVRLNRMLYAYRESKSFVQYFHEGLSKEIALRGDNAVNEERDKLRYLLLLCSDLMAKLPPESDSATSFQNMAIYLTKYLLLHKSQKGIRAIATVLTVYGESMFRRCTWEMQVILQCFEVAAKAVLPQPLAQDMVSCILNKRRQWEAQPSS